MSKWNLFIARHGETEANIKKSIVGITDVFLTEKWKNDAHNLWINITKDIDLIITSPQTRAIHSAEIIRKYIDIPIIEHSLLHPQNFWVIEGLTLNEARERWLWEYLHKPDTNKYLHTGLNWESAQEMEARIIPEIHKLISIVQAKSLNILLLSHNSISRCLIGNANWIEPHVWIENNIWNGELFLLEKNKASPLESWNKQANIQSLLWEKFWDIDFTKQYGSDFLNKFAKIVLNEERYVLDYLMSILPSKNSIFWDSLINVLRNTIEVNQIFQQIKNESSIPWVYSLLQFWSSVYWRNYCIKDYTDLDVEIIIDENFNIESVKNSVFWWYKYWDIVKDFWDFIKSWADYFSFKSIYSWRLVDFRVTHKKCFDKITENSLQEWDDLIMKEFRKQFRENGIVKVIKSFDNIHQWENELRYTAEWQIIYYPLFQYLDGKFTSWNNLDKYCSFTDVWINEVEIKKKLFALRNNFNKIFYTQKEKELIRWDSNISDIFVRKDRFPQYLLTDLESRYKFYHLLSSY